MDIQTEKMDVLNILKAHNGHLENNLLKGKKKTVRKGLTLWQIFVLAQFRLGLNLDYDRLHYMVSSDSTLRQLLGIETESGFKKIEIGC